jgi:hypothetical protein
VDAHAFQILCTVVLALTFGLMWRATPASARGDFLRDAALIAAGAWLAEETAILRYAFYRYGDVWWLMLDEVPALVVLIWAVVVLSSRAVVMHLWPAASGWRLALGVGLAVSFDASLIETVAVDARLTLGGALAPEPRLWWWSEGGYLEVPLIGMLGWGAYAGAITGALGWARRPLGASPARLLLAPFMALGLTHAALVTLWWGGLRFALRGPMTDEAVLGGVVVGLAGLALVLARRRVTGGLRSDVAVPRMLAAAVFFVLLAFSSGPRPEALWTHLGAVALPWLGLTDWRGLARWRLA